MTTLKNILRQAIKQSKPVFLIYGIQLILATCIGAYTYWQLGGTIGQSLELDRLAKGFDRSVFSDLMNESPMIIEQIRSRFGLLIMAFLLLSVFTNGGLIYNLVTGKSTISNWWRGGTKYYFKFFIISLLSLLSSIAIVASIFFSFFKIIGDPLAFFISEKPFILWVIGLIVISVLVVGLIWLWSILTRYYIATGKSLRVSMKNGVSALISDFKRLLSKMIMLFLIQVLLTVIYTLFVSDWGAETWFCVLGLIVIQQIFAMSRIYYRVIAYETILETYSSDK